MGRHRPARDPAGVILENCTFVENGQSVDLDGKGDPTWAKLTGCLIFEPDGLAKSTEGSQSELSMSDGVVIDEKNSGRDPRFIRARPEWEGGNDDFRSETYPETGYQYEQSPTSGTAAEPTL